MVLLNCPPSTMAIPPVGIGAISEYLRLHGFDAPVIDLNIELFKAAGDGDRRAWDLDKKNVWLDGGSLDALLSRLAAPLERCVERALGYDGYLIGMTLMHSREQVATELIRRVRERDPGRRIVLGGPLFSSPGMRHAFSVHCDYDWAVVGEGELAARALLELVGRGEEPWSGAVQGMYLREEILGPEPEKVPHPPIVPLDQLPFPRYGDLDPVDYQHRDPFPAVWSRGCPGRCAFCESWRIWGSHRQRSPWDIQEELRFIRERFWNDHVAVFDAVINADIVALERLGRLVVDRGPRITWEGNFIASRRMSPGLYRLLRRAGCRRAYFGMESGSPRVVRLMKKPFSLETLRDNITWAHGAGIEVFVNIITGFPGEGEREFEETLSFLRRHREVITGVEFVTECQIPEETDLMLHPERFGIVIPEKDAGFMWRTEDGANTMEVRKERSRIVHDECVRLGLIAMPSTTLTDGLVPSLDETS